MKMLRSTHAYTLICSLLFLFPYTLLSVYKDEVYISQSELNEILKNTDLKYVYLGRELSDLYDVVLQASDFDTDKNSPVWQLKRHLEDGNAIGLKDAVLHALVHAESILQTKNSLEAQTISDALVAVIDQVMNDVLTPIVTEEVEVDDVMDGITRKRPSYYPEANPDSVVTKQNNNSNSGCAQKCCTLSNVKVIKVREKLDAFDKARFKKDVEIDGSLVVRGNTRLHSKLKVYGKAIFKEDVCFLDDVCFKDEVEFKDEVTFKEDVEFEEDVHIEGDLTVDGTVTFNGPVNIPGVLTLTDVVIEHLSATDIFVEHLSANDAFINNLTVTDLVVLSCMDSLCVDTLSITDLVVAGCLDNLCVNNLSVTDLAVASCIDSLCVNNLTVTDLVIASCVEAVCAGTLTVTDLVVLSCVDNLCVNNLTVTDLAVLSCMDSLCVNNLTVNDIVIASCLDNLCVGTLSVTDLVVASCMDSLCVNNLSAVDVSISGTLSANDVVISGAFSVVDLVIGCDLTVGCNINMNDSISPAVGNILKAGNRFMHNFGTDNTFLGSNAGNFTMGGAENVGIGHNALISNTTGFNDVAVGSFALTTNVIGANNVAVGTFAVVNNTDGNDNVGVGSFTLASNTTGSGNIGVGFDAGFSLATGSNNTLVGNNVAVNLATGSTNVIIGFNSGLNLVTGNDNIYIANAATAVENGIIRIGTPATHVAAFMQGVFTSVVGGTGIPVFVDAAGQLGTVVSKRAFKHDIQDMNNDSANIYKLRPVTFVYNNDESNVRQYGLIAEEVNDVFSDLVVNDDNGEPYTVRYHLLPMLLLNEVQKLNDTVQEQALTINELKADNKKLSNMMQSIIAQMKTLAIN